MMSFSRKLLSMNVISIRLAARALEAGGSVCAPALRKIAAYLAIHREMPLLSARNLLFGV
jgi:hypothetical protein